MAKVQERKETSAAAAILLSYPREGELITSADYTFRAEAPSAKNMEISIDQSEWRTCRQAGGYWWYDWAGYRPGKHQAVVRMQLRNGGKTDTSRAAHFQVEAPKEALKLKA